MSEPIDYIDLTVDSPVIKPLRARSRNAENISNNSTITKSRKRTSKQETQFEESVEELPAENTCKDAQAMEIINLDSISVPEQSGLRGINDSTQGDIIPLICPICYEQLSSKMKPMSTRCGHIFCSHCLELAMRNAKRCPTCKKAVKLQSCTRLYF